MEFPTHIVAVAGFITNTEGKVLLVKNPRRGWEFPGGQVEIGEDLITALKREIEEESGIIAEIEKLVGVYSNVKSYPRYDGQGIVTTKVIFDFIGKMISGEPRTSNESLEVGWFERKVVPDMITNPANHHRMKNMLEFNGQVVYRSYSTNPYKVYSERIV